MILRCAGPPFMTFHTIQPKFATVILCITIYRFRMPLLQMPPAKYKISNDIVRIRGTSRLCPLTEKMRTENDAGWCNRFAQNSHGEPIGDKTDSCQICNLARWEVSEMPPTKYNKS